MHISMTKFDWNASAVSAQFSKVTKRWPENEGDWHHGTERQENRHLTRAVVGERDQDQNERQKAKNTCSEAEEDVSLDL